MAALSPWVWFAGYAGLVALTVVFPNPILFLVLVFGGIESWRRWKPRNTPEGRAYHAIPARTRALVAVVYLGLAALLAVGVAETFLAARPRRRLRLAVLRVARGSRRAPACRRAGPCRRDGAACRRWSTRRTRPRRPARGSTKREPFGGWRPVERALVARERLEALAQQPQVGVGEARADLARVAQLGRRS